MSKDRADRLNLREVDSRVASVSKAQLADRERVLKLEKENAELREKVEALAPKPNALPAGHYLRDGEVYDRLGNHVGILDCGKFVAGVPRGSSVLDDGRVVSADQFAWHRGRIVEGKYHDEPEVELAKLHAAEPSPEERAAKINEENLRLAEEHRGIWRDPCGIWRDAAGKPYVPGAVDHQAEAVMHASQREHRAFLEASGVEGLRPLPDDD